MENIQYAFVYWREKKLVRQLLWICTFTLLNASNILMYAWLSTTRHLLNYITSRIQGDTNLYENQIKKNNQKDKKKKNVSSMQFT